MMTARWVILLFLGIVFSCPAFSQDTLKAAGVEAVLYKGTGKEQPLVVGLGGSEGGNAWTGTHWKKTRDEFLQRGYAFLAIGYFGCKGTPDTLDRIAIDGVYAAIAAAHRQPGIVAGRTAVIGGSRGAELALLLASYYPDISCVIGLSASHAVFPGHTMHFTTSCWTYAGRELPFVPVNEAAVPFLMKNDLRGAFEAMLQDTVAEKNALIPVEKIKGAVLLMSGKSDEICPSTVMCNKMMERLQASRFKYPYEHEAYAGGHGEPLRHFDKVFSFLQQHFPVSAQTSRN